ncbi:hypothetical protein [Edaphobacillus lindanitolerans]|uniref:Uncharacterized protein n=1 Tax=Edaphobacillus lindanitolerans TaxID=550447 RepID=A0A1U7PMJ5_9BACI|nr:hypothetical protein [Edaphobacillus lindanitolerans]SIT81439.1 hypothetical protein SAMN05428946_1404 [Edaphobacillus lindanitolerans]
MIHLKNREEVFEILDDLVSKGSRYLVRAEGVECQKRSIDGGVESLKSLQPPVHDSRNI